MRLSKDSKIEKLVSKDPTQRILAAPWLDIERGVLLASPGQSCVMVPVTVSPDDTSGPVPVEAIKAGRKGHDIECGVDYCVVNGTAWPRSNVWDTFPPVERLMVPGEVFIEVNLNAKMLHELANGMGADVIRLRVPTDPAGPIVVVPHPSEPHVDGAIGAILPYRVRAV